MVDVWHTLLHMIFSFLYSATNFLCLKLNWSDVQLEDWFALLLFYAHTHYGKSNSNIWFTQVMKKIWNKNDCHSASASILKQG